MISKEVVIDNQVGLHARPATFFIQKANEFKSSIWVEKEERRVNAKSLLGVLSLGIVKGTAVKIIADGADEEAAIETLSALIVSITLSQYPKKQNCLCGIRNGSSVLYCAEWRQFTQKNRSQSTRTASQLQLPHPLRQR